MKSLLTFFTITTKLNQSRNGDFTMIQLDYDDTVTVTVLMKIDRYFLLSLCCLEWSELVVCLLSLLSSSPLSHSLSQKNKIKNVVEFGTSFGISNTVSSRLAAALPRLIMRQWAHHLAQ